MSSGTCSAQLTLSAIGPTQLYLDWEILIYLSTERGLSMSNNLGKVSCNNC